MAIVQRQFGLAAPVAPVARTASRGFFDVCASFGCQDGKLYVGRGFGIGGEDEPSTHVALPASGRCRCGLQPAVEVVFGKQVGFNWDVPTKKTFTEVIRRWLTGCLFGICFSGFAVSPAVIITNLPAYGTTDTLKGYVIGADSTKQALAVFIYAPTFGWYSKPFCSPLLVPILPDGSWSANITTAGPTSGDPTATRIAVLLVSTNYNVGCVTGPQTLSTNVYAQAIAKTIITRPSPNLRFINFSGYDWWVKSPAGLAGPGPNYFSDATNNVWVDTNGWLHLRVTHRTNAWQCAEIVSARTIGQGNYRFEVNSAIDSLNQNVTLGLFTWSDDPTFTDREIDVEGGRWGNPADTDNAQFVVQPFG